MQEQSNAHRSPLTMPRAWWLEGGCSMQPSTAERRFALLLVVAQGILLAMIAALPRRTHSPIPPEPFAEPGCWAWPPAVAWPRPGLRRWIAD